MDPHVLAFVCTLTAWLCPVGTLQLLPACVVERVLLQMLVLGRGWQKQLDSFPAAGGLSSDC